MTVQNKKPNRTIKNQSDRLNQLRYNDYVGSHIIGRCSMSKSLKLSCPSEFGGVREISARIGSRVYPDGWYESNKTKPVWGSRLAEPQSWQTGFEMVLPSNSQPDHYYPVSVDVTGRSLQYFNGAAYVRVSINWLNSTESERSSGWMLVQEGLNVFYPNYDSSKHCAC